MQVLDEDLPLSYKAPVSKDLMKLQKKMQESKKKRQNQVQGKGNTDISVPHSIDTLMLKYGPTLPSSNSRLGQGLRKSEKNYEEIASYKKDAMRLIINRIQRQMSNAFEELQKKVMRDDIMRLKRNGENIQNQEDRKVKRYTPAFNNENDYNLNNMNEGGEAQGKSQFRQMFEQKKMKIKATYEMGDPGYDQQYFGGKGENEYGSQDENPLRVNSRQNNRYQSESEEEEEQIDEIISANENRLDVIKTKKSSRMPKSQQQFKPTTIAETSESFEISPQKVQNESEIIMPSKKIRTYMPDSDSSQPVKGGLIVRSNRQQDVVEMSFNDNPFDRRTSILHGSMSMQNQSSPDFKNRGDHSGSLKQLKGVQNHQKGQQKYDNFHTSGTDNSLSKISEISSEQNTMQLRKPKFSDKLKNLMTEFEVLKMPGGGNSQFTEDMNSSIEGEEGKGETKLGSMKKRLEKKKDQKQFKEGEVKSVESWVNTPLGKMCILAENSVLFEEKRVVQVKPVQPTAFKVKGKKQTDQAGKTEVKKGFHALDAPTQQKKKQQSKIICNLLQIKALLVQKEGFMLILEHSISKSKAELVDSLFYKLKKRRLFKRYRTVVRKEKARDLLSQILKRKISAMQRKVQKCLWSWSVYIQWEQEQIQIISKERIQQSAQGLYLVIKHKQTSVFKSAFDQIKQFSVLVQKQAIEQVRSRSVQKIVNYLKERENKLLNKKFQKYRKQVALFAFDSKITGLNSFLQRKVMFWKKESFKEIIGFCLKNQEFKKQIEQLNHENQSQKQKLIQQQLIRAVKLSKNFLLRFGFKGIEHQIAIKQQKLQSFKKLHSQIQKQLNQVNSICKQRYFKKWVKVNEHKRKVEYQKELACKKLKSLLITSSNKILKMKFQFWKNEVTNFLTLEMTKINHEKEVLRNTQLEQVMVDLWWSTLQKAFAKIKLRSKLMAQLKYVYLKHEQKGLKKDRLETFQQWKAKVYREKLIKVNLQVMLKSYQSRTQKQKNMFLQRWKGTQQFLIQRDETMFTLIRQKINKQVQLQDQVKDELFQIWKSKIVQVRFCKSLIEKILNQEKNKQLWQYFGTWKDAVNFMQETEQKTVEFSNALQKVQLRFKFKKMRANSVVLSQKKNSAHLLMQCLKVQREKNIRQGFMKIKDMVKLILLKENLHQEGAKLVKRLSKTLETKKKQKFLTKWKMNQEGQKAQVLKNNIEKQLQSKILVSLVNKLQTKGIKQGFGKLKEDYESQRQEYQEKRISKAISKISSATKICQLIENKRIDRQFFFVWKQQTQKIHSIYLGQQILNVITDRHLQRQFTYLKQNIQLLQIEQTKKQIRLNLLRVLSYKLYKDQLQRSFNIWMLQESRTKLSFSTNLGSQKPPKYQTNDPTNPPTITVLRILGNHSRANSANNSMNQSSSGRNMRYSNNGDDDDEYEYYEKRSESPRYQDQDYQRNPSLDHARHQEKRNQILNSPSLKSLEESGHSQKPYYPIRSNKKSRNSLASFEEHELEVLSENSPRFSQFESKYSGTRGDMNSSQRYGAVSERYSNYDSKEEVKSIQNQQQQSQLEQKQIIQKGNSSRNKTQSLNKYLNQPDSSQSKKATTPRESTYHTTQFQSYTANGTIESSPHDHSPYHSVRNGLKDTEKQLLLEDQQKSNDLSKNLSMSRMMSPRSQTQLEPVPEESYKHKRKGYQEGKIGKNSVSSSNSSKLSSFLSSNTGNASGQPSKQNKKQQQLENQQKFNMFLKNASKGQDKKPIQSYKSKQGSRVRFNSDVDNSQFIKRNQNVQAGLEKLQKIIGKRVFAPTLSQIITSVFSQEYDEKYMIKVRQRRLKQLDKCLKIRLKLQRKNPYMVWEAFAMWKRLDYLSMLTSLQQFKSSLDQIYNPKTRLILQ